MCTVSIIPLNSRAGLHLAGDGGGPGFRIVCNRDESDKRAPAGLPKWRSIERTGVPGARAIWPMDMEAGGTWIAAAQHGVALCLLNFNLEPPPDLRGARGLKSRGLVIPHLIGATNAEDAMRRLERLSLKSYAPFRLVAVDGIESARGGGTGRLAIAEARWDRRQVEIIRHASEQACFVSSGLGDSKVTARLGLFEQMVVEGEGEMMDRQDEFHRHQWPERPEVSVMMCRADARTVSVTTIEAFSDGRGLWDISMEYEPIRVVPEVAVRGDVRRAAGAR
jgi:hypothetical protein